ncbi:MAG: MOSC domain-containing protein [Vulcanimicrobiaceae bacterium]
MITLGTVARIWRYPVKALAGEPLDGVEIDERGLLGDRQRALFVATPGEPRTGKPYRGKEHNRLHTVQTIEAAQRLGVERSLALEPRAVGPYFDAEPVSIILDHWIAEVERIAGTLLEPLRFRPNLFVRTMGDSVPAEAELLGRTLTAGGVRLRVVSAIVRCVTPSYDVATGEQQPLVQRAIVAGRDNIVGVYCRVESAGRVACGDALLG